MLAEMNTVDCQYCYFTVQGNGFSYRFLYNIVLLFSNTKTAEVMIKFPPAVLTQGRVM